MERVDKAWKDKGLGGYSTAAILGSLGHYGAPVDEAQARAAVSELSPMALAARWRATWKGTGQWATYPYAAAEELSRRFNPSRPTPMQLGEVVAALCARGAEATRTKAAPPELAQAFEAVEAKAAALPPAGDARDAYLAELVGLIEPFSQAFTTLPKALAQAGLTPEAKRFALVHEALFADRVGVATLMVDGVTGDRAAAVAALAAKANAPGDVYQRFAALDALVQLDAYPELKATSLAVFDAAAEAEKWGLADSLAHLLADLVRSGRFGSDEAFIREVGQRFTRAHQHASH